MSKRIKKPVLPVIQTRQELERVVGEIAELTIQHNEIQVGMDKDIEQIRTSHEKQINKIAAQLEEKTERVQTWAANNPEVFGKLRSIELIHGVIGYRTGNPKLKTLYGFTFAKVLEALRIIGWGKPYIRTKEEVDKEQLIADARAKKRTAWDLKEVGAKVVQEETFFIEPKLEKAS